MAPTNEGVSRYVETVEPSGTALEACLKQTKTREGSVHVIVSVGSGDKTAQSFYDQHIPKLLHKFGLQDEDFSSHITQSEQSITELANKVFVKEATSGRPLLIVVLSGDGGVIDILDTLASVATSNRYVAPLVALIPLGTANALAHSSQVVCTRVVNQSE